MANEAKKLSVFSGETITTNNVVTYKLSEQLEQAFVHMMQQSVKSLEEIDSDSETLSEYEIRRLVKEFTTQHLEELAGYRASEADKLMALNERYNSQIVEFRKQTELLNAKADHIIAQRRLKAAEDGEDVDGYSSRSRY